MTREEGNGRPRIQAGTIVQVNIPDIVEATEVKKRLVHLNNNFSYEIAGVHGNYKIIRRELEATESRYVN